MHTGLGDFAQSEEGAEVGWGERHPPEPVCCKSRGLEKVQTKEDSGEDVVMAESQGNVMIGPGGILPLHLPLSYETITTRHETMPFKVHKKSLTSHDTMDLARSSLTPHETRRLARNSPIAPASHETRRSPRTRLITHITRNLQVTHMGEDY